MELQYILFDLDGTLTNSEEGIIKCVRCALNKLGREIPGEEDLLKFIGPPLVDSFRDIMGMTKEEAAELNELFETSNFKPEMSGLSLYTTLTQINSKTIKPGENNLRLISIQGTEKISKMIGRFITKKNKKLIKITAYSKSGKVLKEFDFNCSTLYIEKGRQSKDIDEITGEIGFIPLVGDVFVPRSHYIGFKVLYDKEGI